VYYLCYRQAKEEFKTTKENPNNKAVRKVYSADHKKTQALKIKIFIDMIYRYSRKYSTKLHL